MWLVCLSIFITDDTLDDYDDDAAAAAVIDVIKYKKEKQVSCLKRILFSLSYENSFFSFYFLLLY